MAMMMIMMTIRMIYGRGEFILLSFFEEYSLYRPCITNESQDNQCRKKTKRIQRKWRKINRNTSECGQNETFRYIVCNNKW